MTLLARAYPPSLGPPKSGGGVTQDLAVTGVDAITLIQALGLILVIAGITFLLGRARDRRRISRLDWEDPESGELWPASRESGRGAMSRREDGFTLIELMVVVLIIGVLITLALPQFLKAQDRAQDRVAQARLTQGMTVANVFFTDDSTYVGFPAAAPTEEPGLNWVTPSAAATADNVTINTASSTVIELSTKSDSGTTYCIMLDQTSGTARGDVDGHAAACSGGW